MCGCEKCCVAFWAKIFYIVLIAVVFGMGVFVSFDVYQSSSMLVGDNFEKNSFTVSAFKESADIKTNIFGIPYLQTLVSEDKRCLTVSFRPDPLQQCRKMKNGMSLKVGGYSVSMVTQKLLDDIEVLDVIQMSSLIGGICGCVVGAVLILCVLFCCVGCCTCCCCDKVRYAKVQNQVYV